jgi:acetylornithine deacetylase
VSGVPADGPPAVEADLLAAVAAEEVAMFELLSDLVEAPTLLGAEARGRQSCAARSPRWGSSPSTSLDPEALAGHPGAAPFSWDVAGKANVLATWEPEGSEGRSLILNGHVDVVSPEPSSLWNAPPFSARRDGEWLHGRGSGDMKAGLVAMVGAVRALRGHDLAPWAPVQLQSVVEEECTGNGALACVLAGHTADAAILTEPTQGAIWTAQVGVLWFQVRVVGAPGHAGEAGAGANAIDATYTVIEALRGLEAELNVAPPPLYAAYPHPINLNMGMIRGGDWPSTVAGECVIHCRLALYPGDRVEELRERVERTVAGVAEGESRLAALWIEVGYDGFACEGYELARDAPLVTTLSDACVRATAAPPGCTRRRRPPTRGASTSTGRRRPCASGLWRASTASTSACTCRP